MCLLHGGLDALFLEAGRLAPASAQVVQLRAAHLGAADHFHLVYARRAEEEGALHADTVRGQAAHREIRVVAAFAHADDGAFEFLDALFVAFHNAHVNADAVPRLELGDFGIGGSFHRLDEVGHGRNSCELAKLRRPNARGGKQRDYTRGTERLQGRGNQGSRSKGQGARLSPTPALTPNSNYHPNRFAAVSRPTRLFESRSSPLAAIATARARGTFSTALISSSSCSSVDGVSSVARYRCINS